MKHVGIVGFLMVLVSAAGCKGGGAAASSSYSDPPWVPRSHADFPGMKKDGDGIHVTHYLSEQGFTYIESGAVTEESEGGGIKVTLGSPGLEPPVRIVLPDSFEAPDGGGPSHSYVTWYDHSRNTQYEARGGTIDITASDEGIERLTFSNLLFVNPEGEKREVERGEIVALRVEGEPLNATTCMEWVTPPPYGPNDPVPTDSTTGEVIPPMPSWQPKATPGCELPAVTAQ